MEEPKPLGSLDFLKTFFLQDRELGPEELDGESLWKLRPEAEREERGPLAPRGSREMSRGLGSPGSWKWHEGRAACEAGH